MTRDELVTALAEDQEITRTKVEDILQALTDLCAEALASGQAFNLGELGFITVRPPLPSIPEDRYPYAMLVFRSTERFRTRLGLSGKPPKAGGVDVCKACGKKPVKVKVYALCDDCLEG